MNPKILSTARLILRPYRAEDLDDLYEMLSDPRVVEFEPYPTVDRSGVKRALKKRMISDEMIAVELKESGKLIGNIYLGKREQNTLELGYVFNRSFWGMGYAKEGCAAVVKEAFEAGVHRICAECDPRNERSWRLLEALGFRREGYLKQNVYFRTDGQGKPVWKDTYIYARLKEETACGK